MENSFFPEVVSPICVIFIYGVRPLITNSLAEAELPVVKIKTRLKFKELMDTKGELSSDGSILNELANLSSSC